MRALVLGPRGLALEDRPERWPHGEAVVRVTLAGICATDLELAKGYMGFHGVPGHEWTGVVEAAPDASWIGRRVVGEINVPCGTCATCRATRHTHCPARTVLGILGRDGAFAERLSLPLANLHPVPDGVPDEVAVFTEPLAAACAVLEQIHVRPSDRTLVLGNGRLGQLVARVLLLAGADVTAAGRSARSLDLLPPAVRRTSPDEARALPRFDVVVDCTGSPDGLALATSLVRPRGTVVMKTTHEGTVAANPTAWVVDEVTLVGSRCGPFAPALRLLEAGLVEPLPLVEDRMPLARAAEAFRLAALPGRLKVLLEP